MRISKKTKIRRDVMLMILEYQRVDENDDFFFKTSESIRHMHFILRLMKWKCIHSDVIL